jgi:hypothetical protein
MIPHAPLVAINEWLMKLMMRGNGIAKNSKGIAITSTVYPAKMAVYYVFLVSTNKVLTKKKPLPAYR